MSFLAVRRDLKKISTSARAKSNAWFFKTGKGEYGEGDRFIGVTMPDLRVVARRHTDLGHADLAKLLASKIHEERMAALIILTYQYANAPKATFDFYLTQTARINNWDLVDGSATNIVGTYLLTHPRGILKRLVRSSSLWERRIAIVSTLALIRQGSLDETFDLCERLMADRHDLMHKACGWMLRETGKKDIEALKRFLDRHASHMPRTMLRYAIERLPKPEQRRYLTIPRHIL